MTDNVIPFNKPSSRLSRVIDDMLSSFKNAGVPFEVLEILKPVFLDKARVVLDDAIMKNFSFSVMEDASASEGSLALSTLVRPVLVPEFGIQNKTDFVKITWLDDKEQQLVVPLPEDLMQNLCNYYDKFPEIDSSFT